MSQKTEHVPSICGGGPGRGPAWGRKVAGCPRCDELLAGEPPRELSEHRKVMVEAHTARARDELQRLEDMRAHFSSDEHRLNRCNNGGPCTRFEW